MNDLSDASGGGLVETAFSHAGAVAQICLNRARFANALNVEMVEALSASLQQSIDSGVALIVLRGHGSTLCGGFDLRGLDGESDASLAHRFLRLETLLQKIHYAPCQTLVYAHGPVMGAGADLMAACRMRLAAPDASFRFPGIRFGILLGTNRLAALIGDHAYRAVVEQQRITAQEAVDLGLVHQVMDGHELDEAITRQYESLTRIPSGTRARLFRRDSRQADLDMGILAGTVAEPGLKRRMQEYWASVKQSAARS